MSTQETMELTRDYITAALFSLMERTAFSDISITDITRKAGVGRATFYRHYKTKEDVIRSYFARGAEQFLRFSPNKLECADDYYEMLFNAFSQHKEHREIFLRLIDARMEYLYLDFLNESMLRFFREQAQGFNQLMPSYIVGSFFNVSLRWIKSECKTSVRKLTDDYFALLSKFLPEP